jgi:hypothetical protein
VNRRRRHPYAAFDLIGAARPDSGPATLSAPEPLPIPGLRLSAPEPFRYRRARRALAPRPCGFGRCSRAALRPGRHSGRSRCSAALGRRRTGPAASRPCGFAACLRCSGRRGEIASCRAPTCSRPVSRPRGFGASPRRSVAVPGRKVDAGPGPRCPAPHPGYEGAGTRTQSRRKNIIPHRKPAATASAIAVKGCRSIEVLSASPREEDASRT